jgi:opine dehydrogenase
MEIRRVAILGSGNGGLAAAGDLTLRGFEINLCELPEFKASIDPIVESKTIELEGAIVGTAKLKRVGTDIPEAIKDMDLIMIVTPALGHKRMATLLAPHVKDGQIVYVNPGSTFGGLEFVKIFREMGVKGKIPIVETSTLTYGARRAGPNTVRIIDVAKEVFEAVFPARETAELSEALKKVFPYNVVAENVIETSLNNLNPVIHPPAALLSASTIETRGKISLYKEGMTPSVVNVTEAIDRERVAVCREMGFREWPLKEQTTAHGYSPERETLYETLHSELFESVTDTVDLSHRYLTEDVGYGMVSFASLAEQVGVPMPTCRAIIELTSTLHGVDHWKEGKRSMSYLGLDGMNKDALLNFSLHG